MAKPANVRVVRPDGTEIACDLIHEGVDADGVDNWLAVGPMFRPELDKLLIGKLPGRTAISFEARWDGGDG